MTDRLQHLEEIFPDLAAAGYSTRSEKSGVYNCIAYAAGDETRKWTGYRWGLATKRPEGANSWSEQSFYPYLLTCPSCPATW